MICIIYQRLGHACLGGIKTEMAQSGHRKEIIMEYNKTESKKVTITDKVGKAGDSRTAVGDKVKVEKKARKGSNKRK